MANQILARHDVLDGWGHVSARSQDDSTRFLISRSKAPALVRADDVIAVDVATGEPVDARDRTYVERHIHAAIYRARPDVQAVVHCHSPGLIPFGLIGAPLRAIFHVAPFLGDGTPIFEIRDATSAPTDLLVSTYELGDALATCLGDHAMVLMRGHGGTVVGRSLRQAVYQAVYAQVSARLQLQAGGLGEITPLTPAEAELATRRTNDNLHRVWDLWVREVGESPA
jgi:HCOMODA/2-hydroxy-3-carboxy-muconic semialdehyde decarboxylase